MQNSIRVRFAPSPTGKLHLGSARTALFNWLFARGQDGTLILRIEDTDPERSKRSLEDSILDDLRWLGLDWDEGPDTCGAHGPYRQRERAETYRVHSQRLLGEGKAYPCYCTLEELEEKKRQAMAAGRTPIYDGTCRRLSEEERRGRELQGLKPAIRFRVPDHEIFFEDLLHGSMRFSPDVIGDFIIVRSDGSAGFNFSVVVDDATMGISHVIRGEDHLTNTARHVLLFEALGYAVPLYLHHSLLLGPDGSKMSKRHGATAVPDYREMGYLPQTLINYLALLSWSPPAEKEVLDKDELLRLFDIGDLSPSPAVFDKAKLDWLNSKHLHMAPLSELVRAAGRFAPEWSDNPHFPLMVESVLDNLVTLSDLPRYLAPFGPAEVPTEQVAHWVRSESGRAVVEKAIDILENRDLGGLEDAKQIIAEIKRDFMEKGLKAREVLMPVRVALTGKDKGPPLPYLLVVLGLEESISRLREL
ncbi:MAG: glutamate--tRNA ligase [Candidatus Solincola sediminis]|nr:MAG: glutamate--tRNA ligase [Candidatus Solincola sediminis]